MPERTSLDIMQERERKTHSKSLELLVSIAESKGLNDDRHLVSGLLEVQVFCGDVRKLN